VSQLLGKVSKESFSEKPTSEDLAVQSAESMKKNGALRVVRLLENSLTILLLFYPLAHAQTSSHPRWALHWYGGKGDSWIDQPSCHPLDYFKIEPKRFDYDSDLFQIQSADMKDDVQIHSVGKLDAFTVDEILHTIGDLAIKMILVQRTPGEFCEIFQQEEGTGIVRPTPAFIVNVSSQSVLATDDPVSGTGGYWLEAYWTFDKNGPIPLDLKIVSATVDDLMTPDDRRDRAYAFDIEGLSVRAYGHIFIQFALVEHQLKVVCQTGTLEDALFGTCTPSR
jgi:hypothetical protein